MKYKEMKDKEIKTTEESEEVKDESQTSSDSSVRRSLNDHISEVLNLNTKKEK